MEADRRLHFVLTAIASVSLAIYIIACSTSFSPDDTQIVYPAFDPQSGAVCIALYDRKSDGSETVFTTLPTRAESQEKNEEPPLLRAEWMPDGRHILVVRNSPREADDTVEVVLIPRGVNEPVRFLSLPGIGDSDSMSVPFALSGSNLFLVKEDKTLLRIDLLTGKTVRREFDQDFQPLRGGDGKSIIGWLKPDEKRIEFALLDPETLEIERLAATADAVSEKTIPEFDPVTKKVAYITGQQGQPELRVVQGHRPAFRRSLGSDGEELSVGPLLHFGREGDRILASYRRLRIGEAKAEHGLLVIPLSDDPLKFTPLYVSKGSESSLLAQPSLSNDGTTWAVATTLFYLDDESMKPDDCALYIVDVRRASPRVQKVAIPVPPRWQRAEESP